MFLIAAARNVSPMDTAFLNRLAKVLNRGKSAPFQRAIERLLAAVQKRYENGEYDSPSRLKPSSAN
jgi:hypothetical protein